MLNGSEIEEVKSFQFELAAAAAMFKFNEAGYDESLDTFTATTQLYKTYGRPTLLYGVENLTLNSGELDRLTSFETSFIKRILKFAPTQ